jgi:hypothetical protein
MDLLISWKLLGSMECAAGFACHVFFKNEQAVVLLIVFCLKNEQAAMLLNVATLVLL